MSWYFCFFELLIMPEKEKTQKAFASSPFYKYHLSFLINLRSCTNRLKRLQEIRLESQLH